MTEARMLATKARAAGMALANSPAEQRTAAVLGIAAGITDRMTDILGANAADIMLARRSGMEEAFIDRLMLDEARLLKISEALAKVASLPDPLNPRESEQTRPNQLRITVARVPLGVVGAIYEARPNVTADISALCIKSGNACVLRGGKEAYGTNKAIVLVIKDALRAAGLPVEAVSLISDTTRQSAQDMMDCRGYLDVLIPRGGRTLIDSVVNNSRVPVIETGAGNCHIYLDADCDPEMALRIVKNAKLSRPSVCNSAEKLLVHKDAVALIPDICAALAQNGCEIRADERARAAYPAATPVCEDDLTREYNDLIISVYVVDGLNEAIEHINRYSTKHSDCIVTRNDANAAEFFADVDSAAVYRNASTRFTDGGEFGMGAEVGISTGKLHARGPFALKALTTIKYLVEGDGQIRE